jgi:periplasmic protein TonB
MRLPDLLRVPSSVILLAVTFCATANDEPGASTAQASPPQSVVRTPIRLDPAHPLRIGNPYYPPESKRLGEQGRCFVNVTIQADGTTRDVSLARSSGHPRLDEACLRALFPGKFIPATENGIPVEKTVVIPIVWSLH